MARRVRSGRAASGLLVAAVAACGLAASLGAGYTVARATLDDASTYVAKGNAVSHVNGESRQVDATSPGGLAKDLEDVETTPLPNGKVVAVNKQTGKVTLVDGSTLEQTTAEPGATTGKVAVPPQIVVAGSGGWLLDHDSQSVRRIGGSDQVRVHVPGKPVDGAPGRDGALIVLTDTGKLYEIGTDHSIRAIRTSADARGAALTVAGQHSYLVRPGGEVDEIDSGQEVKVTSGNGATALRDGRMLVNSPRTGGSHVLIVVREQVDVIDPATNKLVYAIRHGAGTDQLGEPVEFHDRIYLPNYKTHRVIVLDEKTKQAVGEPIKVPGRQTTFALSVDGGRLWANDQYSNRMVEIDTDGVHTIDKGKGNGVSGDKPKAPTRTPPTGGTPSVPPTNGSGTPPRTPPTRNPPVSLPSNPPEQTRKVAVPTIADGTTYTDACQAIQRAGLDCKAVAVGSDGGETDVVKEVSPGAGTRLPEGSQVLVTYYGPVAVPDLADGTTPLQQCQAITAATLTCKVAPATTTAPSPDQFGLVQDTSPAPGADAKTGSEVTVYYYDRFPMPQYSNNGTPGASTCDALKRYTVQLPGAAPKALQCTAPPGTTQSPDRDSVGKVYQQVPAAGADASVDRPIVLTVYGGKHTVADYAANGGDATAARNDCQKWFSGCDFQQGAAPPGGQAELAGHVRGSDPGAGTSQDVGATVHIVVYGDQVQVPPITGTDINTVCAKLAEVNLGCDTSNHPLAKQVGIAGPTGYPVSPADGTQVKIGTTVSVPNAVTKTIQIFAYPKSDDGKVFVVRPEGQVPSGYDAGKGQFVTTGYPIDTNPNWNINEFFCSNCNGHAPNHFVSHGGRGTQAGKPWEDSPNSGGPVANLMPAVSSQTCNTGIGQIGVWRYSGPSVANAQPDDKIDFSIVAQDASPGGRYPEFLGCGWK